jgi:gliding motility-associated-like protein
MNNTLPFCNRKFSKQIFYLTFAGLFILFTTSSYKSQTVAFNGNSNNSSMHSNDGNKKTKHDKSNPPTVTVTPLQTDDTVCVGISHTLTFSGNVSGGTPGYLYQWNSTTGTILSGGGTDTVVLYWTSPIIEWVVLTVLDAAGKTSKDSIKITAEYCADFSSSRTYVCLDTCVYFYDLSSGNPNYWDWTFGNSNADATVNGTTSNQWISHSDSTNDSIFCVKFHTPGWQPVTLETRNANGFDTFTTKTNYIFVGPCPDPSITSTIPSGHDTVCACKCVQFFYADPTDPFNHSVTWYFISTATTPDSSTEANPIKCFTIPGVYYVTLVDTNTVGKVALPYGDSIVVVPCTKPAANISVQATKDTICSGDCIIFNDASCNTPDRWDWAFQGGTITSSGADTIAGPITVCYSNTGNSPVEYQVKMVDTNAFGFDSAYATIVVKPAPSLLLSSHPDQIISDTITIVYGTSVTISETGNDPFPYYWSYTAQNYTDPDSLKPDTAKSPENPIANPTASHWYYVHTVGANGCVANDSVYIKVVKTSDIYVPNAFSPNGDGHDDYLFVRSNFIQSIYFAVYDRWGEKVFETYNQNTPWDGTYKGQPENNGVFAWYLKATLFNGKEVFEKGNVTLIR